LEVETADLHETDQRQEIARFNLVLMVRKFIPASLIGYTEN